MTMNSDTRYQIMYFVLSGIVAGMMVFLIHVSVQESNSPTIGVENIKMYQVLLTNFTPIVLQSRHGENVSNLSHTMPPTPTTIVHLNKEIVLNSHQTEPSTQTSVEHQSRNEEYVHNLLHKLPERFVPRINPRQNPRNVLRLPPNLPQHFPPKLPSALVEKKKESLQNAKIMAEMKRIQESLTFLKPEREWDYNNKWQYIGDPFYRHQVYSAYFDPRTELYSPSDLDDKHTFYGSIRIFAVLPRTLQGTVKCSIRYEDNFTEVVNSYEALAVHEHFNMIYTAYTIMCPLRTLRGSSTIHLPESVAVIYTANPQSESKPTYVPISYPKGNILAEAEDKLAVCIGPLQLRYNEVLRMVEFIEIYQLLGAEKFYFYRLDVTPEIDAVLNYYKGTQYVFVNEWNFHDYQFEREVRYGGILVEFNECMYRATFIDGYKYVAVVDLDEILMPLRHNTLMDYIRGAEDKRTSAFVFRNVFFHHKAPPDMFSVPPGVLNQFLYTQVKIQRTITILQPHDRSKCIVNARATIEMGNHQTWRSVGGTSETNVQTRDGLLFHYRNQCINCKGERLVVDFTARRFGSRIWKQVEEACRNVFPATGICPKTT